MLLKSRFEDTKGFCILVKWRFQDKGFVCTHVEEVTHLLEVLHWIPRAQVVPRQRISTSRFSRLLRQSGNGRRLLWLSKGEVGRGKHLILCEPTWRAKIKATKLKFDHYLFIVPNYRRQLIPSFEFLLIYFYESQKLFVKFYHTIKAIKIRPM